MYGLSGFFLLLFLRVIKGANQCTINNTYSTKILNSRCVDGCAEATEEGEATENGK